MGETIVVGSEKTVARKGDSVDWVTDDTSDIFYDLRELYLKGTNDWNDLKIIDSDF